MNDIQPPTPPLYPLVHAVCIVDEASQVSLPAVLPPLLRALSFVLVGDPHQLPPVVSSKEARDLGYDRSLFQILAEAHPAAVAPLTRQFRMAADIAHLANELVYREKRQLLTCGNEVVAARRLPAKVTLEALRAALGGEEAQSWEASVLDPERRAVFLDTGTEPEARTPGGAGGEDFGGGSRNDGEALVVARLVCTLVDAGLPRTAVAAITPYNDQVAALSAQLTAWGLPEVECMTVDRCQGREWDAVVVSLARGGPLLADERRLNVAVTRARGKLVVVGDVAGLTRCERSTAAAKLAKACAAKGWVVALPAGAVEACMGKKP
jgi:DNA replication ATP-dependent helicase Dna2